MVKLLDSIEGPIAGGAVDLTSRIGVISNFASPNAGGLVVGGFVDNNPHGSTGTLAGAAGRIDLCPYYTSIGFSADQIGAAVSTAVASSAFKILIYSAGADGWPDAKLFESASLSGATVAYAFDSGSPIFTFAASTAYWLGTWHSSTATLRTVAVASAYNLGISAGNASSQYTTIRRTVTYNAAPGSAPASWVFNQAERSPNVTPPSVRMRVSAIT